MRFTLVIGRMTLFDFALFQIAEPIHDDGLVVVHHDYTDDEDRDDGPGDLFNGRK